MSTMLQSMEQWRRQGCRQDEAAWMRIRSQMQFAEWLSAREPADANGKRAVARAAEVVAAAPPGSSTATVAQVEQALAPWAAVAKRHTVYCVGHAHIDMNWLWGWPETVTATLDTFRTVLALMDEFDAFHLSQSQASVYAIVAQHDPALLKDIARRVQDGRWEVTASHWVENDMNLVGAEALARHLSQTRAYMRELFGLAPEDVRVNWAPDTFGHAATVPGYLAQGGVRHVYMHRPGTERQPVPEAFWWQSPDGARVLVRNDQLRGYNCMIEPKTLLDALKAMHADAGLDFTMLVYGVGDHGGGPTRRDLLMLREMMSWPVFPTLTPAPSRMFYERLEREGSRLPVIVGELNGEFTGCYTSQTLIKRDNRIGEARMLDAEVVSALAASLPPAAAGTAQGPDFDENWRRVLFSHFHDILPGSCVHDTRMYCHGKFQDTMAFTSVAIARALRSIAQEVATADLCGEPAVLPARPALFASDGLGSGAGIACVDGRHSIAHEHGLSPTRPFVVFNTTATERAEIVEFTLWDRELPGAATGFLDLSFEALAANGTVLTPQRVAKGQEWGHAYLRYAVPVTAPALGYTTVVFRESSDEVAPATAGVVRLLAGRHHCFYARVERAVFGLENDHLRVVIHPHTGRVTSLFDKAAGHELIEGATGIGLEYAVERPGGMTAWIIEHAGPPVLPPLTALREVAEGPHTAAIEATYKVNASTLRLTFRLNAGEARLQIAFSGEWMERGSAETGVPNLRLAIPTTFADPHATYEVPFGWVERTTRPDQEVPALRWALLESQAHPTALLAINDCKHGHAVEGGTLRINLIRSSYNPDELPEIGSHRAEFALAVLPHGSCRAAATAMAQAFTHPLLVMGTTPHAGPLGLQSALVQVAGEGIVVSCLKRSDDGRALVVRLQNTGHGATKAVVTFHHAVGSPVTAVAVDLLERETGAEKLTIHGACVTLNVPARGIASCKVELKEIK